MNKELSNNIKLLNQIDQHIEKFKKEIKALRQQKASLSQEVVDQLKNSNLEKSVIKTSTHHYKITRRTTRQSFNKKYLTEQAADFLGDSDKASEFVAMLYNNRKVTVNEILSSVRTEPASKDN